MDKLEELKEKLKGLTPEEVDALKTFLNEQPTEETKAEEVSETNDVKEETEPTAEDPKVDETQENVSAEPTADNNAESIPVEETTEDAKEPTENADAEPVATETPTEPTPTEEQEPAPINDDDIPKMVKDGERFDEESVESAPTPTTAETGEQLPVDYEQIIEGLNAKNAALEAENASLKSKVEGAFGYSAKPSMQTKVNRLYDDCEDVHIHR